MKALARLEKLIQEIVERPAALLGSRRLHPLEMAAALTRALENGALALTDRVLVPDRYTLLMNPVDHAQFAPVRATLEREYADYLTRLAVERELSLTAPARVEMTARNGVRPRTVRVETAFTETGPVAPPVPRRSRLPPNGTAPTEMLRARNGARSSGSVDVPQRIEVLGGGGVVARRYPLGRASVVLGRRASSDLALDDIEVSRRHAVIEYQSPSYVLRDLGSTNGTLLNGRRITGSALLADGDIIELGGSRLRFRQGG